MPSSTMSSRSSCGEALAAWPRRSRASRSIAPAPARRGTRARRARGTAGRPAARSTAPDRSVRCPRRSRPARGLRPRRRPRRRHAARCPGGASPGSRSAWRARSARLRQELQQNAAGAPVTARAVLGRANSSATASRTRVGICSERRKYSCAACFEVAAFERDQALIAAHVRALVDGHGEMAVAEQRAGVGLAGGDRRGDALGVEAGAGAHLCRAW